MAGNGMGLVQRLHFCSLLPFWLCRQCNGIRRGGGTPPVQATRGVTRGALAGWETGGGRREMAGWRWGLLRLLVGVGGR